MRSKILVFLLFAGLFVLAPSRPSVHAQDGEPLYPGDTLTVTLAPGGTDQWVLTVTEISDLVVDAQSDDFDVQLLGYEENYIYDWFMTWLYATPQRLVGRRLIPDEDYRIEVTSADGRGGSYTIRVDPAQSGDIVQGKAADFTAELTVSDVPPEDEAAYCGLESLIESQEEYQIFLLEADTADPITIAAVGTFDTALEVYDSEFNQIASSDDWRGTDNPRIIGLSLSPGEDYYVALRNNAVDLVRNWQSYSVQAWRTRPDEYDQTADLSDEELVAYCMKQASLPSVQPLAVDVPVQVDIGSQTDFFWSLANSVEGELIFEVSSDTTPLSLTVRSANYENEETFVEAYDSSSISAVGLLPRGRYDVTVWMQSPPDPLDGTIQLVVRRLSASPMPSIDESGTPLERARRRLEAANHLFADPIGGSQDLEQALDLLDQARDLLAPAGASPDVAIMYYLTGYGEAQLGRYDDALASYEAGLAAYAEDGSSSNDYLFYIDPDNVQSSNPPALLYRSMGDIYMGRGQFTLALDSYLQAAGLEDALEDRPMLLPFGAYLMADIGQVYMALGEDQLALDYFNRISEFYSDMEYLDLAGPFVAQIEAAQGKYYEALSLIELSLRSAYTDDRHTTGVLVWAGINQAFGREVGDERFIRTATRNYAEAISDFQRTGNRILETDTYNRMASAFFDLSVAYRKQDRTELVAKNEQATLDWYQQALDLSRVIGDREAQLIAQDGFGAVYRAQGQRDAAIAAFREAADLSDRVYADLRIASAQSAVGEQTAYLAPYENLVDLLAGRDASQAFEYAERGRARTLLFQLANAQLTPASSANSALVDEWQTQRNELRKLREELTALYSQPNPDSETLAELERSVDEAERNLSRVEDRIALQSVEESQFTFVGVPDTATMQAHIPSHTTLLSYYVTPEHVYAFVVTNADLTLIPLEVSPAELYRTVQDFRSNQGQLALLRRLYAQIFASVQPFLDTPMLVVIPHKMINGVPFAALVAEDGSFLSDSFTIRYAPSAATFTLLASQSASRVEGMALVLGDPVTTNQTLAPLPFAGEEAEAVAALLGTTALTKVDATEGHIWNDAARASVIHIAAHGVFNYRYPSASYLALAPDDTHDGTLEIREVSSLDLHANHPLVVLSACETAVGDANSGDEFQSLPRAFLVSGAQGVIASLWSVDDAATGELMKAFYSYRTHMNTAEALQAAQREIRSQPGWASPYYWAAFILVGS